MSRELTTQHNGNLMIPLSDIERMGQYIAASRLYGVRTPEQAIAIMLVSQAEGRHPALAARDYHIIDGTPSLKIDAMYTRFQSAGGAIKWGRYDDEAVSATFSHPQGGQVEVEWTIARAAQAGLASKMNWKKYPRQMLRARVLSEGIRTVCPGVAVGIYSTEEVRDFDDSFNGSSRDPGAEIKPGRPPAKIAKPDPSLNGALPPEDEPLVPEKIPVPDKASAQGKPSQEGASGDATKASGDATKASGDAEGASEEPFWFESEEGERFRKGLLAMRNRLQKTCIENRKAKRGDEDTEEALAEIKEWVDERYARAFMAFELESSKDPQLNAHKAKAIYAYLNNIASGLEDRLKSAKTDDGGEAAAEDTVTEPVNGQEATS